MWQTWFFDARLRNNHAPNDRVKIHGRKDWGNDMVEVGE